MSNFMILTLFYTMNFEEALKYLRENEVTAYQLGQASGKSTSSLDRVLDGTTVNPQKSTKDFMIEYATSLIKKQTKDRFVLNGEEDDVYFDQLAIETRKYKHELMKRRAFKDMIYIEALKLLLEAKEGDKINMEKLERINK